MMKAFSYIFLLMGISISGEARGGQIEESNVSTIDTRFAVSPKPQSLLLRHVLGMVSSDSSGSGTFSLDARSSISSILTISGPATVVGGQEVPYTIQNGGVDVGMHRPSASIMHP